MHDLAQDLKHVLLGDKAGQGVVMSDNSRKVYDRVLEHSSRPLDEIADILQFSMINFASSVTGEHSPPFSLFLLSLSTDRFFLSFSPFSACAEALDFYLRPENAAALQDLHKSTAVAVGLANDSDIQVSFLFSFLSLLTQTRTDFSLHSLPFLS